MTSEFRLHQERECKVKPDIGEAVCRMSAEVQRLRAVGNYTLFSATHEHRRSSSFTSGYDITRIWMSISRQILLAEISLFSAFHFVICSLFFNKLEKKVMLLRTSPVIIFHCLVMHSIWVSYRVRCRECERSAYHISRVCEKWDMELRTHMMMKSVDVEVKREIFPSALRCIIITISAVVARLPCYHTLNSPLSSRVHEFLFARCVPALLQSSSYRDAFKNSPCSASTKSVNINQ